MATVRHWPDGQLEALVAQKLIVETDLPAKAITCDACDGDHSSKVIWLDYPDGKRSFISCPDVGRVPVDPDRLKQWDIDFHLLADKTSELIPGKLTRDHFERIQNGDFTSDDQSKVLDLLGNFAAAELTPDQKRIDSERLQSLLPHLTKYQRAILEFLWVIPVSVSWDQLPAAGFREGRDRTDMATVRALERLDTALSDQAIPVQTRIQIDRSNRRVTLIRNRF